MLDNCIVRITVNKHNVYLHPKYHCNVVVKGNSVYVNGKLHANLSSNEKAKKYASFIKGETNTKG